VDDRGPCYYNYYHYYYHYHHYAVYRRESCAAPDVLVFYSPSAAALVAFLPWIAHVLSTVVTQPQQLLVQDAPACMIRDAATPCLSGRV
jgi:hypothetical protein